MNPEVDQVYRNNAIVVLGHRPDLAPDGSEVPRIRLDAHTTVRVDFLQHVYHSILEVCSFLVHNQSYCLADIIDPDFWEQTDNGNHRIAGKCFSALVRWRLLPFEFLPRRNGQSGTFFYYYVGSDHYQGET